MRRDQADVTKRLQAFEASRPRIESRLDSLVAISPDVMLTDTNEAVIKGTGVRRQTVIGPRSPTTSTPRIDAETRLSLARGQHPDLTFVDIQLPGMDCLAATAILKKDPATAAIPVVARSALAMKADEERGQSSGCDAFIVKWLRYNALYEVVERLLQVPRKVVARVTPPGPCSP
jgi:two-component system cell cycle response regulator DivK